MLRVKLADGLASFRVPHAHLAVHMACIGNVSDGIDAHGISQGRDVERLDELMRRGRLNVIDRKFPVARDGCDSVRTTPLCHVQIGILIDGAGCRNPWVPDTRCVVSGAGEKTLTLLVEGEPRDVLWRVLDLLAHLACR